MINHAKCAAACGMTLEQWLDHYDKTIRDSRREPENQCYALMQAGWTFEIVHEHATEPWQWKWRRPGPRGGRLFHSTRMAYNALKREREAQ